MEDEKKKGNPAESGQSRRPRHGRRKSYFIEPAKQEGAAHAPIADKPVEKKAEPKPQGGQEQKPQGHGANQGTQQNNNQNGNRRNNRHRSGRGHNRDRREEAGTPRTPEQNQTKEQAQTPNQNRNRDRNHEKGSDKTPDKNRNQGQNQSQGQKPSGDASQGGRNRNRNRHRGNGNRRNEEPALTDTLLTESLPLAEQKKNVFASTAAEEEIIPYIPADDDDLSGKSSAKDDSPRVEVIGIRFKASGKIYYFEPGNIKLSKGSYAIVETARGQEYGEVAMGNTMVSEKDIVPPLRPVLRGATPADIRHHEENKKKEEDAFRVCNEKILAHGLDMKLIDAQYTFDNTKLLFYFTSSGRVDFRELVKDLASVFRTRIELRQVGIRDEAKMMGGLGPCGRPLCCTLFLTDFGQVSIKMAKEQNLSLNSSKISGICGRLMCCLRYEHETYEYEIKRTPPVDSLVKTEDGVGVVTEMNPLVGTVKVRLTATPDVAPKVYKRDDVVLLQKKQDRQDNQEKAEKSDTTE